MPAARGGAAGGMGDARDMPGKVGGRPTTADGSLAAEPARVRQNGQGCCLP